MCVAGPVCNRTGYETLKGIKEAERVMDSFDVCPTLILHGQEDTLCFPRGSKELFERIGGHKNELKFYPGLYHELLFEDEKARNEVVSDIIAFINK